MLFRSLEYCVQYNETDYAFVSRLMEEYGIYYYFEHTESDHTMHLVDSNTSLTDKSGGIKLDYYETNLSAPDRGDAVNSVVLGRRFRSGKFSFNDYDYKSPGTDLMADKEAGEHYANASLEMYHYPGRYDDKSVGEYLATIALEAEHSLDRNVATSGDAVTCCPGYCLKLAGHYDSSVDKEYIVLRANHVFHAGAIATGMKDRKSVV